MGAMKNLFIELMENSMPGPEEWSDPFTCPEHGPTNGDYEFHCHVCEAEAIADAKAEPV